MNYPPATYNKSHMTAASTVQLLYNARKIFIKFVDLIKKKKKKTIVTESSHIHCNIAKS